MSVQVKGSGTIGGIDQGLNIVGVVTATSFSGAFSGTTGTYSGTVQVTSGNLDIADSIRHVGDSDTKMRFPTADIISFETAGSERLRIASNGQVSISSDGTTDGLLTIKGNTDQVGTPSIRLLDGSDTREVSITNTSGDFVASVHGTDNAIHGHIKMFESGQIDFNNGGASGSNTNRLRIATDGKVLIDNATGTLTIGGDNVYDSAKINLMVGSSSQTSATTEATALVIHDRNSQRNGTEGAGSWKSKITFRSTQINGNSQSEGASIVHDITYNNYSSNKMRSDLVFKTRGDAQTASSDAATEKLRIRHDGRVLIGTNSTYNANSYSNNLVIYENGDTGASIIGNNSNSNYASLYLSDTSTPSRAYLESQLGSNGVFTIGQNGTGRLRYVLNGNEKFCMTHTGRFGVGDTDPDFAVHIKGNVPAICFEDTDGTHGQAIIEQNGDELKIRQDAGNASSGTGSTILFQVDASTKMRIDGTGYVGINRTSPAHYLDVDGTSLFRNRVFISSGLSMKSTPFGANVTYDTGISVNGGGYGGSILAICSKNYGAGTNTQSGVYLLKFHYDGNTGPTVTLIAGSNLATFGKSGSNTLTVAMGASNNMFTAIESSVVNA